jgi:hypothetical protein
MEHHHHQQQQQLESDSQVAVQSLLSEALTYDGLGRPKVNGTSCHAPLIG